MTVASGVIIGYGNPLCGDDAWGWVVVERLRRHPACCDVGMITAQQLTPELAVDLQAADWVYFVDISNDAGAPALRQHRIRADADCDGISLLGHYLSPAQLLALTRQTFSQCPEEAYVVTSAGINFGVGQAMSPEVEALLPEVEAHLLREIGLRQASAV